MDWLSPEDLEGFAVNCLLFWLRVLPSWIGFCLLAKLSFRLGLFVSLAFACALTPLIWVETVISPVLLPLAVSQELFVGLLFASVFVLPILAYRWAMTWGQRWLFPMRSVLEISSEWEPLGLGLGLLALVWFWTGGFHFATVKLLLESIDLAPLGSSNIGFVFGGWEFIRLLADALALSCVFLAPLFLVNIVVVVSVHSAARALPRFPMQQLAPLIQSTIGLSVIGLTLYWSEHVLFQDWPFWTEHWQKLLDR